MDPWFNIWHCDEMNINISAVYFTFPFVLFLLSTIFAIYLKTWILPMLFFTRFPFLLHKRDAVIVQRSNACDVITEPPSCVVTGGSVDNTVRFFLSGIELLKALIKILLRHFFSRKISTKFGIRAIHAVMLSNTSVKVDAAEAILYVGGVKEILPYSPHFLPDFDKIRHVKSTYSTVEQL